MALAWYEKMSGAGRSGQIVSSEQLLNELRRLDCRFRQRGSHITFSHDDTGTRGTIVYGTRKLWSQKTVAAMLLKMRDATGMDINVPNDTEATQADEGTVRKTFNSAVVTPSAPLPAHFVTEPYQGDPSQIVIRDRDFPQIGDVLTPYDHPDIVAQAIKNMARKRKNFEEGLAMLADDGDFKVMREGDVIFLSHPIHPIQAVLGPYDAAETQEPLDVLNQCFDDLAPFADNQTMLRDVITSRKLDLINEKADDNGVLHKTYVSRRFQRGFGVRVNLETSKNGYVSDKQIVDFMDGVDKNFFDSIAYFMKNSYGFEVARDRRDQKMHASHPMLKDLGFDFPNFDNLPKLRDVYAKREQLGEEAYINGINDILEQRDNILELVSYGLIFSVEQMMAASDTLFDIADRVKKIQEAAKADKDIDQDAMAHTQKTLKKKISKIKRAQNGSANADYDTNGIKDQNHISSIRNQKLPETFPYGRVMRMPLQDPKTDEPAGHYQYMVIKGPDGKNMVIFGEDGLKVLSGFLEQAGEALGADTSAAPDAKITALKGKSAAGFQKMIPAVPV